MLRSLVEVKGFFGGPAYNVIHWRPPGGVSVGATPSVVDEFHAELVTLYDVLVSVMPTDCTYTILPDVTIFDETTGKATGLVVDSGPAKTYTGTDNTADVPRSAALNLGLITEDWKDGRRVQGRLYLGPVGSRALDSNGQVTASVAANLEDACTAMISGIGPWLQVWSRPKGALATNGSAHDVVRVKINSVPSSLRRRLR
jgi:hypothetical protein